MCGVSGDRRLNTVTFDEATRESGMVVGGGTAGGGESEKGEDEREESV